MIEDLCSTNLERNFRMVVQSLPIENQAYAIDYHRHILAVRALGCLALDRRSAALLSPGVGVQYTVHLTVS